LRDTGGEERLEHGRGTQAALGHELAPAVALAADDGGGLGRGGLDDELRPQARNRGLGGTRKREIDGFHAKEGRALEDGRPGVRRGAQPVEPLRVPPRDRDRDRCRRGGGDVEQYPRRETPGAEDDDIGSYRHASSSSPFSFVTSRSCR